MTNSWTFDHLSLTVRDLDKAIQYYKSLGAVITKGPLELGGDLSNWKIYGKTPGKVKFKACHFQIGSLNIEMHQPVEGETLWSKFLEKHGEGIDHVGFIVDDVQKEAAKMAEAGFPPPIMSITEAGDKLTSVFADTCRVGNIAIQLYQGSPLIEGKATKDGWTFSHIGVIVRNIDKAVEHYQSLGADLIDVPMEHVPDLNVYKIYGKTPPELKFKACHLQLGSLKLEVHQPVEGDSPWQEFLDKHGEGIDHINFFVDDVKKEASKMADKGAPVIKSAIEPGDKWVSVYLDSRKVGNIEIEFSNKALIDAHQALLDAEQAAQQKKSAG